MGQQGAPQSNDQNKEADITTTWHFIFIKNFTVKRETTSQKYFHKRILSQERTVSPYVSEDLPCVFLCLYGSGGVRHVRTAQKMPKKPGPLQLCRQRTHRLPWFDCDHLSDSLYHYIVHSPLFFHLPQVEMFPCISLLCSVFNRCW